jgi:5-methyltetrahydropteroyltriglutamate--homocysteine methyltransferase
MDGLETTVIGSYTVPDWYSTLREAVAARTLGQEQFADAKAWAARAAIADQERAGIEVVSDGELFRRDDNRFGPPNAMIGHFAAKIPGFADELREKAGITPVAPEATVPAPVIVDALEPTPLGLVDELAFLRAATARPAKIAMTGPHMFSCVAWDEHYGDREAVAAAMSAVVNAELRRLDEAGCDVVQLDEPIIWFLEDDAEWAVRCVNRCFDGVTNATRALHLCQGNYNPDPAARQGLRIFPAPFEAIVPVLEAVDVDLVLLAFSGLDVDDLGPLATFPSDKTYGVGAIDVQTHRVETADEVATTIDRIHTALGADVVAAPDCGLNHLPRDVAFAKLRALADGAAIVRGRTPAPERAGAAV